MADTMTFGELLDAANESKSGAKDPGCVQGMAGSRAGDGAHVGSCLHLGAWEPQDCAGRGRDSSQSRTGGYGRGDRRRQGQGCWVGINGVFICHA